MLRPFMSYALIAFTLISQVGIPLHLHYCKGILESVSVLLEQGCTDPVCGDIEYEKELHTACCEKKESCCDDEVKFVSQDVDSPVPHYSNWIELQAYVLNVTLASISSTNVFSKPSYRLRTDTGPPIYILIKSLIFYA